MASGILGKASLVAATETVLYTVPTGRVTSCSVNICNVSADTAKIRLALVDGATTTDAHYIEYDTSLASKGVMERTGLVVSAGQKVVVQSDTSNVSAVVYGFEE
jgi:hypothetical protein